MADAETALPDGWTRAYSRTNKRYYYCHMETNHSQWHLPTTTEAMKPRVAERNQQRRQFHDNQKHDRIERRVATMAVPTNSNNATAVPSRVTPSPFTDRYAGVMSPPSHTQGKKRPPPTPHPPSSSRKRKRCMPTGPKIIYQPPFVRDINAFVDAKQIGQGTYGSVFVCKDKSSKQRLALKRINADNVTETDIIGFPLTALREMKILKALHHDNILNLKEVVTSSKKNGSIPAPQHIFMVFDYHEYDLTGILQSPDIQLTQDHIKSWSRQLLLGCHYLHTNKIIHRDLKASNLLINRKGQLRIADFGLARSWNDTMKHLTTTVITLNYRPPELLLGCRDYNTKVDMWSVGCIIAEMFRGMPLFRGTGDDDQYQRTAIFSTCGQPTIQDWPDIYQRCPKWKRIEDSISHCRYSNQLPRLLRLLNRQPKQWMTDRVVELISGLLILNPTQRWSAEQGLEAEYFFESPVAKPANKLSMAFALSSVHESDIRRKAMERRNQHTQCIISKMCGLNKKQKY